MLLFLTQSCSGLVLGLALHVGVTLALPSVEVLAGGIKTELMAYLEILTTHLIPAISISLIIRKITS